MGSETSANYGGFKEYTAYVWTIVDVDQSESCVPWFAVEDFFVFGTGALNNGFNSQTDLNLEKILPLFNVPLQEPPLPCPPFCSPEPPDDLSIPKALDANKNGVLDDSEILRAIQLWILNEIVPGTSERIDDKRALDLIEMWILG